MIFSRDNAQHEPDETTNRIRAHHAANLYSIQKHNSIRYKSALRRAIPVSIYKPADAIFDRQPRRLETRVTHTKQTAAILCNRPLSRTSGPANLTQSSLPSDLIFDDRNPRA
jgi:hypothetical protein